MPNDEMEDIVKIVKCLEDSGLSLKGVSEIIGNEAKEQKGEFLSILLGTLGTSLLGNILAGKGINRAGEWNIRAGCGSKNSSVKIVSTASFFDIRRYYQNELRFNGVYYTVNLPKNKGWGICRKSRWIF